jgi:hypothetical protein
MLLDHRPGELLLIFVKYRLHAEEHLDPLGGKALYDTSDAFGQMYGSRGCPWIARESLRALPHHHSARHIKKVLDNETEM